MNFPERGAMEGVEVWPLFPPLEPAEKAKVSDGDAQHQAKVARLFSEASSHAAGRHIKATTVSFSNMHEHGDLLANFLRKRKEIFVDELHWDLPNNDGMEFDQYDNPFCRWLIIHEFGEILGGLRLTPTTARCGIYTYMLRDAQNGLLEKIPTDVLCIPAPVSDTVWEGTRLFISDDVGAKRRFAVQMLLMRNLLTSAADLGVSHLIGFVPSYWYRWIRRMDLRAVAVGPKVEIDGVFSQAALMKVIHYVN